MFHADIAAQYIRKLNITNSGGPSIATRLSLLITLPAVLQTAPGHKGKPTTFVAFTPATSFQFGSQMGTATERAVLHLLLREHLVLQSVRRLAAQRIFQGAVASRRRFLECYVEPLRASRVETGIQQAFIREFDNSPERDSLISLVDEVTGRQSLTAD